MNSSLCVVLNASPEQAARLRELQASFSQACNSLAPLVQDQRCWNRVTLHHLAYRSLRDKFPEMGSQMICNAIYSVSLTGRMVFQHPDSPFHHAKLEGKRLPLLRFSENSPVYFDRHTMSVKGGTLSLYTLQGRMRCALQLTSDEEHMVHERKLRDVVLSRRADGVFELMFNFAEVRDEDAPAKPVAALRARGAIPAYVQVEASA
ncbi:hypothetical protein [Caenimonas aquaedulcis]|uniref:Uncharacterized protein n=1 Tax=Caenimonas aquaedulcis TaxID=2793270 RepID=A0A931H6X9_9BURK|nr:hypothetical protein [Caenimonas aquaedulcis]MBG9389800.1 hypothetical protein [Caenimonas aquaedulcis]